MVAESPDRLRPHQIFQSDRHSSAVLLGAAALGGGGEIGPVFRALTLALPVGKTIGILAGGTVGAWLARRHSDHAAVGCDLVALAVTGGPE